MNITIVKGEEQFLYVDIDQCQVCQSGKKDVAHNALGSIVGPTNGAFYKQPTTHPLRTPSFKGQNLQSYPSRHHGCILGVSQEGNESQDSMEVRASQL